MADSNIIPLRNAVEPSGPLQSIAENISIIKNGKNILSNVTITPGKSGISVILGANGAGKSMLLKVLAGLIPPNSGAVNIDPRDVGYVAQTPILLNRTLRQNLIHALKYAKIPRHERPGRVAKLLVQFQLTELSETHAESLSGGERHKLAIARAMVRNPKIILCDEPTANLDPKSTAEIEILVSQLQNDGHLVLWVTHDIAQAKRIGAHIYFLDQGQVLDHKSSVLFFNNPHPIAADYIAGRLPQVNT